MTADNPDMSSTSSDNGTGGFVAMIVQLTIYPVKARERLKESLASAIVQINKMESFIALGVDDDRNIDDKKVILVKLCDKARNAVQASLNSADVFLGFTAQEPRLKGNFDSQAVIYKEVRGRQYRTE